MFYSTNAHDASLEKLFWKYRKLKHLLWKIVLKEKKSNYFDFLFTIFSLSYDSRMVI